MHPSQHQPVERVLTQIQTVNPTPITDPMTSPHPRKPRSSDLLLEFLLLYFIIRIDLSLHGLDLARPFGKTRLRFWQINGPRTRRPGLWIHDTFSYLPEDYGLMVVVQRESVERRRNVMRLRI